MTTNNQEVIIIGGGPAGSACALNLLKLGYTPLIVEKEDFPRWHIGESMTGEVVTCLKELGLGDMPKEEGYPCKKGVRVFGAGGLNDFFVPTNKPQPSGERLISNTYSVSRDTFDKRLLDEAVARGAILLKATAKRPIVADGRVVGVELEAPGGAVSSYKCDVLVDASGQNTFLSRHKVASKRILGRYSKQVGMFSHFKNCVRGESTDTDDRKFDKDNTLLFYRNKMEWAWFIPVSETVTSVGIVLPPDYIRNQEGDFREVFLQELDKLNPELARRVPDREMLEPIRSASSYSYRVDEFIGHGFVCIGDAHRFVDPIFSFGVFAGFKEASYVSAAIDGYIKSRLTDLSAYDEFKLEANQGQDAIETTLDCFWEFPRAFQHMCQEKYYWEMSDVLAGRVYGQEGRDNPALKYMAKLLSTLEKKTRVAEKMCLGVA